MSANSNITEAISGNIINSGTNNKLRGRGQRKRKRSNRYDYDYDNAVFRDQIFPKKKKSAGKRFLYHQTMKKFSIKVTQLKSNQVNHREVKTLAREYALSNYYLLILTKSYIFFFLSQLSEEIK